MKQRTLIQKSLTVFVVLILLILGYPTTSIAQEKVGRPAITNYYYSDYGDGPVTVGLEEGDNGIKYFAKSRGVLEFDGVNWKLIELPDNNGVGSIAKDKDGTLYVSAEGNLGYLKADEKGKLFYVSLKDKIPAEHRNLETVARGAVTFQKIVKKNGEDHTARLCLNRAAHLITQEIGDDWKGVEAMDKK